MKKSTIQIKGEKSGEKFGIPALAALKRAAKRARETAKLHGTKIYVMREGKIVAEKP